MQSGTLSSSLRHISAEAFTNNSSLTAQPVLRSNATTCRTSTINRFRSLLTLVVLGLTVGIAHSQGTVQFPSYAAGTPATSPLTISLTAQQPSVLSSIRVVTQGIANVDFVAASGGTCSVGNSYFAGQTCTVNILFQPKYPGERRGAVTLLANDGTAFATELLEGYGNGPLGVIIPGVITTVAGNGSWVYQQDGVAATTAPIFLPMGEATDAAGNLYLCDSSNNRVRKVDVTTGLISTIAGNGEVGFSGDNGPATNAAISAPSSIVLDGSGNIYFTDSANHAVRMVNSLTGIITTIAGLGNQQGYSGDGGLAVAAKLNSPYGLAFDAAGNLYIADTGNSVIRKLTVTTGVITTVAGTGVAGYKGDGGPATAAKLNSPWGITFGGNGNLYIADLNNNVVRQINVTGIISTVAGTGTPGFTGDGSIATVATLNGPAGIAVDVAGNVYIADSGNNRIRKVNATTGIISTLAGVSNESFIGDGGNSNMAGLYGPYSLFLDESGSLYVSDMFHNRIRRISSNTALLQYQTIRVNRTSPSQPETFENDGNTDLTVTSVNPGSNAALDSSISTCISGLVLSVGAPCILGVEFAPTVVGDNVTGSVNIVSDATNSPGVISLVGKVLTVDPTTVTLTSSTNPVTLGAPLTLMAHVTTAGTSVSGTIQFLDGSTPVGTVALDSSGVATFATSSLSLGQHTLTASYSGDTNNAPSTSTVLSEVVKQGTSLALKSSLNPAVASASVTFTATLSSAGSKPGGTVTFSDNSTTIGVSALDINGAATLSIATLSPGSHSITATYSGDSSNMSSQSAALTETISQAATTTTLTANISTISTGGSVIFTASVSSSGGGTVATGLVTFKDGTSIIGTSPLDSAGVATFPTSTLTSGQHSITAVYQGDTDNLLSTSAALVETVQQITTSTILVSDTNPANAGAVIHLSATVSAAGGTTAGGPLTGLVTFQEGSVTLGTGSLSPTGTAALSLSTLTVGQHNITATYAGNTNYGSSSSVALVQTVRQSTTTIALSSNVNPSIAGLPITLVATVGSVGGVATGTVTFSDGATILGHVLLDSQGKASLTTAALSVGQHSIVATYSGDSAYVASTSIPFLQTVQIATTSLSLTTSMSPATVGVSFNLTALLSVNGGQPSGSIIFRDGAVTVGTVAISGTSPAIFKISTLSPGVHSLTAFYAGDANDGSSTSAPLTQVIQQATTVTTLLSSLSPSAFNQAITFTANVTSVGSIPGGTVTFQDGNTILDTVNLNSSGVATFSTSSLALGTHSILATYSSDTNHSASKSLPLTQQILQATSISITSTVNPAIAGKSVTLTARIPGVGGLIPTGTVTFMEGSVVRSVSAIDGTGTAMYTTNSLSPGAHSITAVYGGDTNYQRITSPALIQTIQISDTNVNLVSGTNPSILGSSLTFTASLTGTGGPITGTIVFEDGSTSLGKATLNAAGVATFTTTSLSSGIHAISALYSGDSNNTSSNSAILQQQVQQTATVVLASNHNPSLTQDLVTLTCSVANGSSQHPSGKIVFSEGATALGIASLDINGSATLNLAALTAGQHSILATYSGDSANLAGVSSTLVQTVQLRPTSEVVTGTTTSAPDGGRQVTLISVVRWNGSTVPTGTVTFKAGSSILGTGTVDQTGVATLTVILSSSSISVVASYSGDSIYAASDSDATPISNSAPTQFTMQISPSTLQLQTKQHSTVSLTLTSLNSYSDTLALGCLGLPFAATCTFSSDQTALQANGTQVVKIVIDTGSPLSAGSEATASKASPAAKAILSFPPLGALLGVVILSARRRRLLPSLLLVLVSICFTLGLSGCGTLNVNGTPAGTYSFKVTASGRNTGVTQSTVFTLTVTQ